MAEDLDVIYNNIESLSRKTLPEDPIGIDTRYAKYFEYSTSLGSSVTINAENTNRNFSQYQESIIRLTLDHTFYPNDNSGTYDGYSVVIYAAGPNDTDPGANDSTISSDNYESKFKYKIHLKPIIGHKGVFEVHINELLGRQLKIGIKNQLKFVFKIIAHNKNSDQYESIHMNLLEENKPLSLEMYQTNASYSSQADDLTNAFIAINELKELI